MRDDLTALWPSGWRLLLLRAGPEDLPYSPALTWVALALMASVYPAWMATLASRSAESDGLGLVAMLGYFFVPAGAMLGVSVLVLRAFGMLGRFHQFALALGLVHGLGMAGMFGPVLARMLLMGDSPSTDSFAVAMAWLTGLVPTAALLWYGLAMSHVWARTLERGYGLGLLMTLVQNAAMWVFPVVLLVGVLSLSNLFN